MSAIHLRGIEKRFGEVLVLEGIDLQVDDGAFVALLGPSGCGKSTLIRIVAGLDRPDRGEVRLGDRIVFGPGIEIAPEARKLGMVFQSYAVWPHRTVLENVAYPLRVRGAPKQDARAQAEKSLQMVRLDGLAERYPHELSGGQQQRVAIARALVGDPEVLLLDEPLSNLDARLREEMRQELSELRRALGVTVLLVTHDQAEALSTADLVAVMRKGRIAQLGRPEEIYAAPADLYVARVLGAMNALPVRAIRDDDGALVVSSIGGLEIAVQRRELASRDPAALTLAVRPERVALASEGGLGAEVASRAFLGGRVELELRIEEHKLTAIVPAAGAPVVGAQVRIRLESPQLLLREG